MSEKQITAEHIRIMRFRYRHDSDLVRVLTELLEYREAEDRSGDEIAVEVSAPEGMYPRNHLHSAMFETSQSKFVPKDTDCADCRDYAKRCQEIYSMRPRTGLERECGPQAVTKKVQ